MAQKSTHQPHDKLFKTCFQNPENTAAFLQNHLPGTLGEQLDFSKLQPLPNEHISQKLNLFQTDLLFNCHLKSSGAPVIAQLILEHQHHEDPWRALRLLGYQTTIWTEWQKKNPHQKKLPLIIPIVVAQNKIPWNTKPAFGTHLFALPQGLPRA